MDHPSQIDGHRVLGFLGRGGAGQVYRVILSGWNSEAALKLLRPPGGTTDLDALRFRREYRLCSNLRHPALVPVYGMGFHEGAPYFTMELVAGEPLRTHLERYREGSSRRAWLARLGEVGRDLLDALAYIHGRAIVHRDLKPENVLVEESGRPRLMDFGLARAVSGNMRVTDPGTVVGTVHYMAPEQLGTGETDARSDLYSFGVMLYEALSGKLPFDGPDLITVLGRILVGHAQPLREVAGPLPPALVDLVERLIRREPSDRPPSAAAVLEEWEGLFAEGVPGAVAERAVPAPPAAPAGPFEPRFVGRARELRELCEGLERMGGVYLVTGEVGMGKTRLVGELLARCRTEGVPVARGQAVEVESLPYGMWLTVLRRALGDRLAPELEPFRGVLSLLLPELSGQLSGDPSDPLQRYRLFEGMVRLLRAGAEARGLAVSLEDVHWADPASLEFLHYLARQMAEPAGAPRLLLVATCRDEEAKERPDLQAVLESLDRTGLLRRIPLEPLREAEVEQMIRSMLGAGVVEPDTTERLFAETEGNPLFVGEILKAFLAEGQVCLEGGMWHLETAALPRTSLGGSHIPVTVREAVERRLRGLGDRELRVARLGALLGRTFHFDVVARAAEEPPEELLDRLEALLARRILTEGSGTDRGAFTFYHHQIREVLLESLPGPERIRLHARVARALEAGPHPEEVASELAWHYENAGEPLRASEFLVLAGEASDRAYAYERAARLYRSALHLRQVAGAGPDPGLDEKLADATYRSGRAEAALDRYTWLAEAATDKVDRARLLRKLSACWERLGDYEQAQRCVRQGLDALGERPSGGALAVARGVLSLALPSLASAPYRKRKDLAAELSALCDQLVHVQFFLRPRGWVQEALDAGARQLLAARATGGGDPAARGRLLMGYLLTAGPPSRRRMGLKKLAEGAAEARKLPPSPARATMLREAGYLMHMAGDPRPGLDLAREAMELSDRLGDVHGLSQNHAILSSISAHLGRVGEAVEEAALAADMADLTGNRVDELLARINGTYAEALRGRTPEARRMLEACLRRRGSRQSPWIDMLLAHARGWVELLEGRPEEALATARATRQECLRIGAAQYYRLLLSSLEGEALLACATSAPPVSRPGRLEELRRCLNRLRSEGRGYALFEGRAARLRGRALALEGRPEQARRLLERAMQSFAALDSAAELAATHQALAALLAVTDPNASRHHLERSREANLRAGCQA